MDRWLVLHPKAKLLFKGIVLLLLGSVPAVLHNDVSLNDALIADITGAIALITVYFSGSGE